MSAAPKNAASNPTSKSLNLLFRYRVSPFLATLVVLHFTPVSKSLGGSQFRTSVAWSLQACFFMFACVIMQDCVAVLSHVMVLTCYIVLASVLPQPAAGSKCRNSNFNSGGWSGSIVEVAAAKSSHVITSQQSTKRVPPSVRLFPRIMFVSAETHYMVALRVLYWKQRNTKNQRRQKTSIKAKRKDS